MNADSDSVIASAARQSPTFRPGCALSLAKARRPQRRNHRPRTDNREPRTAFQPRSTRTMRKRPSAIAHRFKKPTTESLLPYHLSLLAYHFSLTGPPRPAALLSSNKVCCPEWRSVKVILATPNAIFGSETKILYMAVRLTDRHSMLSPEFPPLDPPLVALGLTALSSCA